MQDPAIRAASCQRRTAPGSGIASRRASVRYSTGEERQHLHEARQEDGDGFREQVETLRAVCQLQREVSVPRGDGRRGRAGGGAGHLASLQEDVGELQRRVEALAGAAAAEMSDAAGADPIQALAGRCRQILDALERACTRSPRVIFTVGTRSSELRRRLAESAAASGGRG